MHICQEPVFIYSKYGNVHNFTKTFVHFDAKSSKYGAGAQMGAMAPVSWVQEMNNVNKAR